MACFLSSFLLIFAVHLAAASSRSLTFSFCFRVVRHLSGNSPNVPLNSSKDLVLEFHCLPIVCSSVFGFHPVHLCCLFHFEFFVCSSSCWGSGPMWPCFSHHCDVHFIISFHRSNDVILFSWPNVCARRHFFSLSKIFVLSLPTQGMVHSHQLFDVIFACTHHSPFHFEITCIVLASHRHPPRVTLEKQASYISKLLLEAGSGSEVNCCTSLFTLP